MGTSRAMPLLAACLVCAVGYRASANPLSHATSLHFRASTATSTCLQGVATSDMFTAGTNNWRSAIASHGVPLSQNDSTIWFKELADPMVTGGQDNIEENIDTAHISFLATHGAAYYNACSTPTTCSTSGVKYIQTSQSGAPDGDCATAHGRHTNGTWYAEMRIGNSQINYFDNFACNSLNLTWTNDYQSDIAHGVHQWHGFAGIASNGAGTDNEFDDYVNAAYSSSASQSWVIWLTSRDHWGTENVDVCATSRTWGNSDQDTANREMFENYGGGSFGDANTTNSLYTFFADCNPQSPIQGYLGDMPLGYFDP